MFWIVLALIVAGFIAALVWIARDVREWITENVEK